MLKFKQLEKGKYYLQRSRFFGLLVDYPWLKDEDYGTFCSSIKKEEFLKRCLGTRDECRDFMEMYDEVY